MAKEYSIENVAKIYDVSKSLILEWVEINFKDKKSRSIKGEDNGKIAHFLGVSPKSLSGKNKRKEVSKKKLNSRRVSIEDRYKDAEIYSQLKLRLNAAKYQEEVNRDFTSLMYSLVSENLKAKVKNIYDELPLKLDYINRCCEKKYFTWKDIRFSSVGAYVDPNVLTLSIPISGPTKILNSLSYEYFSRKHGNKLFKVYVDKQTNKVELSLSPDVDEIRSIISSYLNKKSVLKVFSDEKKNPGNLSDYKSSKLDRDISYFTESNKYIAHAANLMKVKDTAIALWENNNSVLEESILLVLKNNMFSYVVWENINDKRACYVFKYKSKSLNKKLVKLKELINSKVEYKRWNLYNRNYKCTEIGCENYWSISHDSIELYDIKLKVYLDLV